jgi:type IV secretory pathway VirB10-like protein
MNGHDDLHERIRLHHIGNADPAEESLHEEVAMSRILIAIVACAALPALAESNTMTGQPGFFKPTPDGNSSISRVTPPPERMVIPGATSEPLVRNPVLASPAPPQPEPSAEERARLAESDMDRVERDQRETVLSNASRRASASGDQ